MNSEVKKYSTNRRRKANVNFGAWKCGRESESGLLSNNQATTSTWDHNLHSRVNIEDRREKPTWYAPPSARISGFLVNSSGGAALFFSWSFLRLFSGFSPAFLFLFLYFSYTFLILFFCFSRKEKRRKDQEKTRKDQEKTRKEQEKTRKDKKRPRKAGKYPSGYST